MKPGINITIVEGTSKTYCSISYIKKGQHGRRANRKAGVVLQTRPVGLRNVKILENKQNAFS